MSLSIEKIDNTDKILAEIGRRAETLIVTYGLKAQSNMKQLAPVDTGRLRASITADNGADSEGYFSEIGTNLEYAPFVEYGTSRQKAQPFAEPGFQAAVQQLNRVIIRGLTI